MRLYTIAIVIFVLAAAGLGLPAALAESSDEQITFIVPMGTPVTDGFGTEMGIFTGQPLGVTGAGSCESGDDFPLQDVVFVQPHRNGGAVIATVIVITRTGAIPAGTRLEDILPLSQCTGPDGSDYEKYTATIR